MPNNSKFKNISAVFAVLWAAFLIFIPFIPQNTLNSVADFATDFFIQLTYTFTYIDLNPIRIAILDLVRLGFPFLFFCFFAFLAWNCCRLKGMDFKKTMILPLALTAALAGIFELTQLIPLGLNPRIFHFLINAAGGTATLGIIALFRRFPRIFNRETVSYIVCGALTTLVNIKAYGFCYIELKMHNLISNTVAWVLSVLFAYVVNKIFVFQSRTKKLHEIAREIGLFVGARLFSFAVDQAGMWIMVDILRLGGGISKIAVNVIVLIMNYFFSKLIIFKKTDNSQPV